MEGVGVKSEFTSGEIVSQEPISKTNKQGAERLANGEEICLHSTPRFSRQHTISFKR